MRGYSLPSFMSHYKCIVPSEYKYITPCNYKFNVLCKCKCIVSFYR
jgi:hypothetical protein